MQEIQSLNLEIIRLLYIPGLRGDQHRKWLLAEVSEFGAFEGPFESYVPSLIDSWCVPVPGDRRKIHELVEALRLLDLAAGIGSQRINESEVEVKIPRTRDSSDDDFVNIADVGLAVSTVLPVLVALIQADPGQLVYIEQPELHLRPRAQWRLGQLLAEAANRGVRLVIETHSSLLLRGILTQVAENRIASDKVILHWFERDEKAGISTVHSKEPDPAGRVGEWPEDFSEVELKSDNEYLDAVEKKLFAETK
jgi:predicted ATPase